MQFLVFRHQKAKASSEIEKTLSFGMPTEFVCQEETEATGSFESTAHDGGDGDGGKVIAKSWFFEPEAGAKKERPGGKLPVGCLAGWELS